jgi:hypothetical protein
MKAETIKALEGKTPVKIEVYRNGELDKIALSSPYISVEVKTLCDDQIIFYMSDNTKATMYHEQDCCENVTIEDISGDFDDLIGNPLIVAEERGESGDTDFGSETYTFYTLRGIGGSVDIRWYGESNGYYSERVDILVEGWGEGVK